MGGGGLLQFVSVDASLDNRSLHLRVDLDNFHAACVDDDAVLQTQWVGKHGLESDGEEGAVAPGKIGEMMPVGDLNNLGDFFSGLWHGHVEARIGVSYMDGLGVCTEDGRVVTCPLVSDDTLEFCEHGVSWGI